MTSCPTFSIPQPCYQSWAAMTPTAAGRHCGACQTEVVDFTRMGEAQVLAYLAARKGQPVCGLITAPTTMPQHYKRSSAPRRWLLAALALLGWQGPALAGPPVLPPVADNGSKPPKPGGPVVVRGTVLDDRDGRPVPNARVFINDTKYGATTDAKGCFELVMPATWAPIKKGKFVLRIEGSPFDFNPKEVAVAVPRANKPLKLTVTMQSIENRGRVMGKMTRPEEPIMPPRN